MSQRFPAILLAVILTPAVASAQAANLPPARNAIYFELLGNGGLYSLNFDRRIAERTTVRAGFASWTTTDLFGTDAETSLITVPVLANFVGGSGSHHAELGGGLLLGRLTSTAAFAGEKTTSAIFNLTGVAGYRYQKPGRGVVFRVGITPFYSFADERAYPDPGFFPSIGVSFGYAF